MTGKCQLWQCCCGVPDVKRSDAELIAHALHGTEELWAMIV